MKYILVIILTIIVAGMGMLFFRHAAPSQPIVNAATPSLTNVPWYRGDQGLTGFFPASPAIPAIEHIHYIGKQDVGNGFVTEDNRIYWGSLAGIVYAVRTNWKTHQTSPLWTFKAESPIEAAPCLYSNTIFIGDRQGRFYALDSKKGILRWHFDTNGKIIGSANFYAPTNDSNDPCALILVASHDNHLYGLSVSSGKLQWQFAADSYLNAGPAISGHLALIGGCDGYLRVIDCRNGKQLQQWDAGSYIPGAIALRNDIAYGVSFDGKVFAYDITTQQARWQRELDTIQVSAPPACSATRLIVTGQDGTIASLTTDNGTLQWRMNLGTNISAAATLADSTIYVGGDDGWVYVLAAVDGTQLYRYDTGSAVTSSLLFAGDYWFVGTESGSVCGYVSPTQ